MTSAAGPNAAAGTNGCVYPASVPTLFNQLDAAHVSWKGYAQDLGNPDATGTGPTHTPATSTAARRTRTPGPTGTTTQPNPGSANATDQYVPKHFPFPWFESLLQSGDCNADAHRQPVRARATGCYHDLQTRVDDAGVQLDLAEQLQRRPRRGLPRQQPVRRLLRPQHAERRRSTTPAACTPRTCSSSTSSPRSSSRRRSRTAA